MGYEDSKLKALVDRKIISVCLLLLALCIAIYLPAQLKASRGAEEVSSIKRGSEKRSVELHALFSYEGETLELSPELTVLAEGAAEQEAAEPEAAEGFLAAFSDKLFRRLSKDSSGAALELPAEDSGVSIKWTLPAAEAPSWIFGLYILLALLLWFSKYDAIKARRKEDREALIRELPGAILQLCLLLNAGLTVEPAFNALTERNASDEAVLSKCFVWIRRRAAESNSSFVRELYAFSKDFGNRDFARFASLCMENVYHGSELSAKLEAERSRLWGDRLLRAKAAAKEAETKLCFPLMLMLLALLIICTLPAMSGM